MDSAWVAIVRAETWNAVGVNSPAILFMLGIISSRPCDAVNVVAKRAGLQRAMDGPGSAAFALHLRHLRHRAPDISDALRSPLIGPLAHVRRGRDGINGDHFVDTVRHMGHRFVGVHGLEFALHDLPF